MMATSAKISEKFIEEASPTFETTRENIRRLTCLLHGLSPQLCAPIDHAPKDSLARFYAHLALTLTVGGEGNADALAVTGGPLTTSSHELSVVGGFISEERDNEPLVNDFRIVEINLEGELDSEMHAQSTVINRVQSVLQKLRSPACDEGSFVRDSLMASLKKGTPRTTSDRFYLKPGVRLANILMDWEPKITDTPFQADIWIRVREDLAYSLETNDVKFQGVDGAKEFLLSNENLAVWLEIFAGLLCILEEKADGMIAGTSTGRTEEEFVYVHGAVYGFSKVVEQHPEIFDKTSLKETILEVFKSPPEYIARSLDPDDEHGIDSPDHLPWLYDPRGKGVGAFILHYLSYVFGYYLSASAVFRKSRKFFGDPSRVRVYYMTARPIPDARCDYKEVLSEVFPVGHDTEFKDELMSRLLEEGKFQKGVSEEGYTVTGQVHCEATLMALAATKQTGEELGLEESKLQVIKDSNRRIGVAKKCCWCCYWLQNKLNSSQKQGERFNSTGTHGLVFPWAPPAGLDHQIWFELEKTLKDELKDVVRKRVNIETLKAGGLQSLHSSPPSSDEDGPGTCGLSFRW